MRDALRTKTRALMEDRALVKWLEITESNLTWEQVVKDNIKKVLSRDALWLEVIKSSQRSSISVNEKLGFYGAKL